VHITLRGALCCFRSANVFPAIRAALVLASDRGLRIVQFSVQENHLHLIVEADSATASRAGSAG
jgi:REP element-mobilizing transposase RayT